jgi:hypothetical protein
LQKLSLEIFAHRPSHRRHVHLDYNQKYALIQQDYTLLSTCIPAIAIEIKPKYAFTFQNNQNICQYCLMQMYKKSVDPKHVYPEGYCPMDLFSRNHEKVHQALLILFQTPEHHHTRLFINGSETLFENALEPLTEFMNQKGEFMNQKGDIIRMFCQVISLILCHDPILDLLQKSHSHSSIDSVYKAYLQNSNDFIQDVENLGTHLKESKLNEIQQFLVAKSLMDCSLIISLDNNASFGFEKMESFGLYYKIQVIDVEPKSPLKILFYVEQEKQMQDYLHSNQVLKKCC